jgi:hypothetical protein
MKGGITTGEEIDIGEEGQACGEEGKEEMVGEEGVRSTMGGSVEW